MSLIDSLGPTALLVFEGIIIWILKDKSDKLKIIQNKLSEEQRKIYLDILDPYITIFSDPKKSGTEALERITSKEYKETGFKLILFGSDNVILAFNNLIQNQYRTKGKSDPKIMMNNFGNFLLEIRKSLGNEKTKLNKINMLESFINDIDKIKE